MLLSGPQLKGIPVRSMQTSTPPVHTSTPTPHPRLHPQPGTPSKPPQTPTLARPSILARPHRTCANPCVSRSRTRASHTLAISRLDLRLAEKAGPRAGIPRRKGCACLYGGSCVGANQEDHAHIYCADDLSTSGEPVPAQPSTPHHPFPPPPPRLPPPHPHLPSTFPGRSHRASSCGASHPILSRPVSSRSIASRPISSRPVPYDACPTHPMPCHPIPCHPMSSHPIPMYP